MYESVSSYILGGDDWVRSGVSAWLRPSDGIVLLDARERICLEYMER